MCICFTSFFWQKTVCVCWVTETTTTTNRTHISHVLLFPHFLMKLIRQEKIKFNFSSCRLSLKSNFEFLLAHSCCSLNGGGEFQYDCCHLGRLKWKPNKSLPIYVTALVGFSLCKWLCYFEINENKSVESFAFCVLQNVENSLLEIMWASLKLIRRVKNWECIRRIFGWDKIYFLCSTSILFWL